MMSMPSILVSLLLSVAPMAANSEKVLIEGSSTVAPFARAALTLMEESYFIDIRQDGSSNGLAHLCGDATVTPAVATASRRIKPAELERCAEHGTGKILEKQIGRDGIVLAQSRKAKAMSLTVRDLYLALAYRLPQSDENCVLVFNDHSNWRDVDDRLPNREIKVIGPPRTSGTKDIFLEKAIVAGARTFPCLARLEEENPDFFRKATRIRQDTPWIDGGEHDEAIVQTLHFVPDAIGIFGYAYLLDAEGIEAVEVDHVMPTRDTIGSGEYTLSRPLFLYTKAETLAENETVQEFFAVFDSLAAIGPTGILTSMGLVPNREARETVLITTATGAREAYHSPQAQTGG